MHRRLADGDVVARFSRHADAIKRGLHLRGVLITLGRRLAQRLQDHFVDDMRDARINSRGRLRRFVQNAFDLFFGSTALNDRPSGEHFVEHQAKRIDVTPAIGLAAIETLRRHIAQRARGLVDVRGLFMAQQAEIRDAGAVPIADQDIGRLDVAVDQAAFVNLRHTREDLAHHHDRTRHRQRTVCGKYLCQRTPFNIFEHHVRRTAVHAGFKHRHDIRMTEFAGGLRGGHQQFGQQRIRRSANRTGFNRHIAPELGVVGEINHAFGAAAEHAYYAKTADVVVVTNWL